MCTHYIKLLQHESRCTMNAHVITTYGSSVENVVGAGILPFMSRVVDGKVEIVYILGQEDFVNGWNQSGCWSAFEGGRQGDETCEQTAAREFFEETVGTIELNGCQTVDELAQSLREKNYVLRIAVCRCTKPLRRDHVTFVVRMPWQDDLTAKFSASRTPLARIYEMGISEKSLYERATHKGVTNKKFNDAYHRKVAQLDKACDDLPQQLQSHNALVQEFDHQVGRVRRKVKRDFVEKRRVAYVTIRMVHHIVNAKSFRVVPYGMRMRYAFIPVIKTANNELCKMTSCV